MIPSSFRALVVDQPAAGFTVAVQSLPLEQLPPGEVLIQVAYSSINYKDGLAATANGKIVKAYPFVPGIDLSGTVAASADPRFQVGQLVIATSYGIGVSHYGGFSEYARIPAEWVLPLPEGLTLMEAMIYGTAGLTAALSIEQLEHNGMSPAKGRVLVTGATGGVGGAAVAMLHKKGYEVAAGTGKADAADYLSSLGAAEILSRDAIMADNKPLGKQMWQAAVDPVGGPMLAAILGQIAYGGSVGVSGLAGGTAIPATVLPFILRGVNLLGIDSVLCPMERREKLWSRMADDLKPADLERLVHREISLAELPEALADALLAKTHGRVIVRMS
jgi:putative YhdH/YhfP family quinone oxidoreductase